MAWGEAPRAGAWRLDSEWVGDGGPTEGLWRQTRAFVWPEGEQDSRRLHLPGPAKLQGFTQDEPAFWKCRAKVWDSAVPKLKVILSTAPFVS